MHFSYHFLTVFALLALFFVLLIQAVAEPKFEKTSLENSVKNVKNGIQPIPLFDPLDLVKRLKSKGRSKSDRASSKSLKRLYSSWRESYGRVDDPEPGQSRGSRRLLQATPESRLKTFTENVERIQAHNKLYEAGKVPFRLGLNQFTDQKISEIKLRLGISPLRSFDDHPDTLKPPPQEGPKLLRLPKSIDWTRYGKDNASFVTPVKSQKSCASCYAFAAIATVESHYSIRVGELVSFSDQQVLDCTFSYGNKGCNNGRTHTIFKYLADTGSICTEESYPYRVAANANQCAASTCSEIRDVKIEYPYYRKLPSLDTRAIMTTVAQQGPVACEFAVMDSFAYYGGGVYTGDVNCTETTRRDHVMLVVGYDTDVKTGLKYWKLKNSWSEKWGMSGYINVERGRNICGIETNCRYPVIGNSDDENDEHQDSGEQ